MTSVVSSPKSREPLFDTVKVLMMVRVFSFVVRLSKKICNVADRIVFRCQVKVNHLCLIRKGEPYYYGLKYCGPRSDGRRFVVLANGPSLSEDIQRLYKQGSVADVDFLMMNYSASQDLFMEIRPRFYALADPMFFREDHRIECVRKLFSNLNEKVSWDMTLILPYDVKDFLSFSGLSNNHIRYQRVNQGNSPHVGEQRFKDFQNGTAMPFLGTVANLAVYAGILYGYRNIELCGVDMSFLEGVCVDDNNQTCTYDSHYYDPDKVVLKPYINWTGRVIAMDDYVDMVMRMIRSHRQLSEFGSYMGVSFINRTRKSWLDCYPRLIRLRPDLFDDAINT